MNMTASNSILIVDDTPNNIKILLDVLNNVGYEVSVAKSGEIALEKLPFIQPDLILLDVMMPGIDGFETCRCLKADENTKNIPVIFMTALSDSVNKLAGLRMGAVDYITKPIEIEEVLARINIQLKLKNTQQALINEIEERRQTEAKLKEALLDLRHTQTQLVQAEKMSSLGRLVAGIAHEINNPISFIYGNLRHTHQYAQELIELLQLYQRKFPTSDSEIQAKSEEADLEFMLNDFPKLLASMKVGIERIREIVLSLRVFSRLDEAGLKEVDIHQGLDSTLTLLEHRLKANSQASNIEVIKDYGNLPLVECYAGQLNQVFMNILNNAIDALLEEPQKQAIPTIRISTRVTDDQHISIRIKDNGAGITVDIIQQIFDPFFTTKPVGVGTGMGLAISYQIVVERHQGILECRSRPGEGTEFLIQIPLNQKPIQSLTQLNIESQKAMGELIVSEPV
ncbi:response regulator receiver sensor signal transduction histidine kinase [Leptolyngbya boryana NIES-2135]|jgi:two-component system NtrC family sensor kinase|uniref:histidine kinase n=1 Tax=Leptolyngbya boryana NIES-2135 TaxID=1973484 RepID=A0A1Z4JDN0_LEPBY|nr:MULTISPECIES: response regulator [Leptolyngbya]BAY54773.1 response regulator receiver sensor signal transduction histidine kinase [Leptolyngbya boryana NIES-2135]MBD2365756.1 response regulator [Leptolyngbya sp. FACHB-161]MBD2371936.1 response regulator [Leptolyngbya sp. FACHB-238]MBD2396361.1 response regulator [Leptolyngbya sp. FACHB-239]MBD2402883.1 response regulator [Leptolyngbya sp. FACHB-402]